MLGFVGPRAEAEQIKQRLTQFLRDDLRLELSQEKTLITHARTGAARFLGYEITVQHSNQKITRGRRAVNGVIRLRVPTPVIKAKCAPYLNRGKPAAQTPLVNRGDFDIVATFGAAYRGLVQYYLLAGDVYRLNRLHGVMRTSMLKTLACKHDSTGRRMAAKYTAKIETSHGLRTCQQVVVERERQEATGRTVRRNTAATAAEGGPRRPPPGTDHLPPKRAAQKATWGQMRDLRATGRGRGSPHPKACRPRPPRTGTTRMGTTHGETAPQNPGGLHHLPRRHPCGKPDRDTHGVVTGEPVAGKASTAGSEGGRGKGTGTAGTTPDGLPCPGNRRSCPGVGSGAPGDPRDMAKAGLPEA